MQSETCRDRVIAALALVALAAGSAGRAEVPSPSVPRTYEPVWVRVLDDARVVRGVAAIEDGGFAMLIAGGPDQEPTLELRRFDASATPVWSLALREGACADGKPEVREVVYVKGIGFTVLGAVSRATSVSYRDVRDVWISRIDESGKHVWQKLIGSPRGDEDGNGSLSVAEDGRMAVAYQQSAPESALERAASFVTELGKERRASLDRALHERGHRSQRTALRGGRTSRVRLGAAL